MRTCPDCHSLVPIPLDACPARRQSCPLLEVDLAYPTEAPTDPGFVLGVDPLRTTRIDQAEIRAALASSALERLGETAAAPEITVAPPEPPPLPLITQPTVVEPRVRPLPVSPNRPALWSRRLAYWSVLPLFPIGFAAVALALIGLARGPRLPKGSGTERAWTGLVTGLLFGSTWLAVTVWLILEALP